MYIMYNSIMVYVMHLENYENMQRSKSKKGVVVDLLRTRTLSVILYIFATASMKIAGVVGILWVILNYTCTYYSPVKYNCVDYVLHS